jgi:cytidylate kinase
MAIITISRQSGSLGNQIAQGLAEETGFTLLTKEMIATMLQESGFSEKTGLDMMSQEKKPSLLASFGLDRGKLLCYIKKMLYTFARQDNVIILGMGGQTLFDDFPSALRIRFIAPLPIRIQRLQERLACDEQHARHMIHDSDHARTGFNRYFFHIEWEAADLYDLIINTKNVTLKDAIRLIKEELQDLDSQEKKEQAAKKLEDLVLQQRVLIGIVYANTVNDPYMNVTIDVTATDATITLKGYSYSVKNRTAYETIARSVPGVKDVVNEIFIKS